MDGYLRQSTASQARLIGPFISDSDFLTAQTGLTIANTDVKLRADGTTLANKNSGGGTHQVNGQYSVTWDATDTANVGQLKYSVKVAGAQQVWGGYVVLEEAVYDALFAASATGTPATTALEATAQSIKTKTDFLPSATAGAAGGVFIAGTNAATTVTTALTTTFTGNLTGSVASVTGAVGSVTGNVGGNVTGSVGSVVGAVGSVTGAVGSVTGNVGGNVTGSVGSVTGNVGGNVVGTVASVVGNVGGNVVGSVASVTARVTANTDQLAGQTVTAAAGVTFPTSVASPTNITAGTITTVTNLTNAATAGDFTATMKTSIGTAVAASAVASVTGNVGGNVVGSVGSVAAGGITASSIATDAIDADAIAADAVTKLADGLLKRDMSAVTGEAARSPLNALRLNRNKWSIAAGTLTVTKEDDTTTAWSGAVGTTASDPVSSVDPT